MNKKILSKDDLKPSIESGMRKIAGIVKRTLGPGGLPVLIERTGNALDGSPLGPKITKDGVSVANECFSSNKEEDLIIQAVKAICRKTNISSGDGTTSAIVLGEAILLEALKALKKDPSLNPQLVREEIEAESKKIIETLKNKSKEVKDVSIIAQVATISANGDESIGKIIGNAFEAVGAEGVVTVDEGRTSKVTLEVVEGYQFKRAAENGNRFFNNKELTQFESKDTRVVIYDGKLDSLSDVVKVFSVLGKFNEQGIPTQEIPPVLFIANDFSSTILEFLFLQKIEAGLKVCAVRGPNMTTVRTAYYDDLAVATGGYRFGNGNKALSAFTEDDEGLVEKVIANKYTTTLYGGQGSEEAILERVDQLKAQKEAAESPYDAQIINDRLAALTNGIAKIGVGGVTEFEIKEKYDRIEDALNAARAGIEEGIVPGGGVTLLKIASELEKQPNKSVGLNILIKALKAPFRQILANIGQNADDCESKILQSNSDDVFDARNKVIVNSMEAGIIDPVKVTRSALENAVSIAALLSTAGGGIIFDKGKS